MPSPLASAATTVGFFTFLSRILGLVRDMALAHLFGSGLQADAFFVAFRIPNLLRRLFAEGSLTIAFIPVFTEYLETRSRKDAFELARVVLTLLSLILVAVTLLGVLFAPWIVRIQAFGFGGAGEKYALTVCLTRITFPYILLISLVAFFMGVLNSLRRFAAPAAAPIFLNVGIIASAYLLSPHFSEPIVAVSLGVILGGLLQVLLQLPSIRHVGLSLAPRWNPAHPAVQRIGRLMLPAVFGSAVYQLNQFMGTLLASFLPEGSISWLYYADRLVQFPLGVFAIALSTAALPSLATHAARKEAVRFNETLSTALCLVFFIALPSTVGLIMLAEPIIRLLFERGAFDPHATHMTARALIHYALGLCAFSGIRILVSAFYALQDTQTPVKVAVAALGANLGLSLLLMAPLRHAGLALALSLASAFQFLLLLLLLRRRLTGPTPFGAVFKSAARNAAAAGAMGLLLAALHRLWPAPEGLGPLTAYVVLLVVSGGLFYLVCAWVFRSPELVSMLTRVRSRPPKAQ